MCGSNNCRSCLSSSYDVVHGGSYTENRVATQLQGVVKHNIFLTFLETVKPGVQCDCVLL